MNRTEIAEKLKEIIIFSLPTKKEIIENCTEESNLRTDIGLNSVGMLYIVIAIEEIFKVSFGDSSFDSFRTVKDVIDYIKKATSEDEMGA